MPIFYRIPQAFCRSSLVRAAFTNCLRGTFEPKVTTRCASLRAMSSMCAPVSESPSHRDMIERAKAAYGGNSEVDSAMSEMLSTRRLVLFMEGSLDHPKSLCAGNLSRIFTGLQVTGLHTVDLLREPEILGFLCTHIGEDVRNVLFKDGAPALDYDQILELFQKGTLLQALEVTPKPSEPGVHKRFRGLLPIANY
ncbi:monothiol glutaredoxin, putative [Babesia ovata]|uniref:Monothiol glutaredoxin, putative n=1 Tax=Babesia ovata TaxID=189622 RepID=A0A2H6KHY0_9APIC|nr:monothiol glutaredoxin, putative [Babesia ovata]GBE62579.1 monothiol glutaredoxin, putative [Babesia ovata]